MKQYTKFDDNLQAIELPNKILLDINAFGKVLPWASKKGQTVAVSEAYEVIGDKKYAIRIGGCGGYLKYECCCKCRTKKLVRASFCRCRLCPLCQWRRSRLVSSQLKNIIHESHRRFPSDIPLLLTLTVPNVTGDLLPKRLDDMFLAVKKLMKITKVKKCSRGWARVLEVTYNKERDDYHPHFHILLMVPMNYFVKSRDLYITRDEWLRFWQEAIGMLEITQVDIRRIKSKGKRNSVDVASVEVGKYATKPGDYVEHIGDNQYMAAPNVIDVLHWALRARRLIGFGGLFKVIKRDLKLQDIEKSNLIKVDDELANCSCSHCKSNLFEITYGWCAGIRNYVAK